MLGVQDAENWGNATQQERLLAVIDTHITKEGSLHAFCERNSFAASEEEARVAVFDLLTDSVEKANYVESSTFIPIAQRLLGTVFQQGEMDTASHTVRAPWIGKTKLFQHMIDQKTGEWDASGASRYSHMAHWIEDLLEQQDIADLLRLDLAYVFALTNHLGAARPLDIWSPNVSEERAGITLLSNTPVSEYWWQMGDVSIQILTVIEENSHASDNYYALQEWMEPFGRLVATLQDTESELIQSGELSADLQHGLWREWWGNMVSMLEHVYNTAPQENIFSLEQRFKKIVSVLQKSAPSTRERVLGIPLMIRALPEDRMYETLTRTLSALDEQEPQHTLILRDSWQQLFQNMRLRERVSHSVIRNIADQCFQTATDDEKISLLTELSHGNTEFEDTVVTPLLHTWSRQIIKSGEFRSSPVYHALLDAWKTRLESADIYSLTESVDEQAPAIRAVRSMYGALGADQSFQLLTNLDGGESIIKTLNTPPFSLGIRRLS